MSESLLAAWQRAPGDAKAFTAWYRSVYPSLLYRASALVGHDMEAARELLQEPLVRLLERGVARQSGWDARDNLDGTVGVAARRA